VLASKYFDLDANLSFDISIPLARCSVAIQRNIRMQVIDLFKAPSLQKNGIKKFLFSDLKKTKSKNIERNRGDALRYPGKTLI
jgi:hypothetical protein